MATRFTPRPTPSDDSSYRSRVGRATPVHQPFGTTPEHRPASARQPRSLFLRHFASFFPPGHSRPRVCGRRMLARPQPLCTPPPRSNSGVRILGFLVCFSCPDPGIGTDDFFIEPTLPLAAQPRHSERTAAPVSPTCATGTLDDGAMHERGTASVFTF